MARKRRADYSDNLEFVTWLDDDGVPVDHVDDRFNSRVVMRAIGTGEICTERVAERGIGMHSLIDVYKMGFTTFEYQAMLKFIFDHDGHECISSEEELTQVMYGRHAGHELR